MIIVTELDYKRAFKEVLTILKYVPKEDFDKIPEDIIKTLEMNEDNSFNYKIDFSKDFEEQDVSDVAKAILANFYRDYWATEEERNQILKDEEIERNKAEEAKRIKYNPDNIFDNQNKSFNIENENIQTDLIVKKENFFQKIISKIKSIIKR